MVWEWFGGLLNVVRGGLGRFGAGLGLNCFYNYEVAKGMTTTPLSRHDDETQVLPSKDLCLFYLLQRFPGEVEAPLQGCNVDELVGGRFSAGG